MFHIFSIAEVVPEKDELAALAPSDVAWLILRSWASINRQTNPMSVGDFCRCHFKGSQPTYPEYARNEVELAIVEGWVWLENHGLLIPDLRYAESFGARVRSRSANNLIEEAQWVSFKQGRLLPVELLHPAIRKRTWATWARGDHDAAVFQAFKELEVQVRDICSLPSSNEYLGIRLMRNVFHKDKGVLTDMNAEEGERQALSDLFAGAIGSYKNPHSHRHVEISAEEAAEMIILASHLLKIALVKAGPNA